MLLGQEQLELEDHEQVEREVHTGHPEVKLESTGEGSKVATMQRRRVLEVTSDQGSLVSDEAQVHHLRKAAAHASGHSLLSALTSGWTSRTCHSFVHETTLGLDDRCHGWRTGSSERRKGRAKIISWSTAAGVMH